MPFHAKQKHLVTQGDEILLLQEQNFNFDMICKYFTGAKGSRYGDLQSLRPVSYAPKSCLGKYEIETTNGFVNITLNDSFLISSLLDFTQNCSNIGCSFSIFSQMKFGNYRLIFPWLQWQKFPILRIPT